MKGLVRYLEEKGIKDKKVLRAFAQIDRKDFVESSNPYVDEPLPIGFDQTISQPFIVAIMLQELNIKKTDHILEVGTGSGYVVALLSTLCHKVVGTERVFELVERSQQTLASLEKQGRLAGNYEVICSKYGAGEQGPYDKIIVSAAAKEIPEYLIKQLKNDGVIIAPIGSESQWLVRAEKFDNTVHQEKLLPVQFVPLIEE